jgi:hypothetical protein
MANWHHLLKTIIEMHVFLEERHEARWPVRNFGEVVHQGKAVVHRLNSSELAGLWDLEESILISWDK